jgi:hypothetical protein
MSSSRLVAPKTVSDEIPAVPLTLEGYSVLHQMMRVRWAAWRQLGAAEKAASVEEAAGVLGRMEQNSGGQSGLFSLLGHKGDLMLVHFRRSFDELNLAELQLAQLRLSDFLEPTTSYLSVIELGLYESTIKAYRDLKDRGRSRRCWRGRRRPCIRVCFRSCPSIDTFRFIPWTGGGARPRTGIPCPLKNGRGR